MISKVSEITIDNLKNYLRLTDISYKDEVNLETMKKVAIEYIKEHTGLSESDIDKYADLIIVVYILCSDMWDNRSLYVDSNNVNKAVTSILSLHDDNLL